MAYLKYTVLLNNNVFAAETYKGLHPKHCGRTFSGNDNNNNRYYTHNCKLIVKYRHEETKMSILLRHCGNEQTERVVKPNGKH